MPPLLLVVHELSFMYVLTDDPCVRVRVLCVVSQEALEHPERYRQMVVYGNGVPVEPPEPIMDHTPISACPDVRISGKNRAAACACVRGLVRVRVLVSESGYIASPCP